MKICPQGDIIDTECSFLCRHVFCKRKVTMNFISLSVALPHHVTNPVFVKPPFCNQIGFGGMKCTCGVKLTLFDPQPIFGRKDGLLKFSLCTECFTVQCYNLMGNNSRYKIYFPCCVSNLVAVISI